MLKQKSRSLFPVLSCMVFLGVVASCKPKNNSQAAANTRLQKDLADFSNHHQLRCFNESPLKHTADPSYYFDIEFSYEDPSHWLESSTIGPVFHYRATEYFKSGNSSKKTGRESKIGNKTLGRPIKKSNDETFSPTNGLTHRLTFREKLNGENSKIPANPAFVTFNLDIALKPKNEKEQPVFSVKSLTIIDENMDNTGKKYTINCLGPSKESANP